MRMPCTVSCIVSQICAPPVNWLIAIALMRRISLRSTLTEGATTTRNISSSTGSPISITMQLPTTVRRSRPAAETSRLTTTLALFAPAESRARNSDEWRLPKNGSPSLSSLSRVRRWLSATMRAPMRASMTAWP